MGSLSNEQEQLLFDYALGLTSERQTAEAQSLISSNAAAAETYSRIKGSLSPLESLAAEPCPDELAQRTVMRLNNLARSSQLKLQQLLAGEQVKTTGPGPAKWLWPGLGRKVATAALFMIVGGVLITTLNIVSTYARHNSWQQQCRMQLANIWRGINHYAAEHDGMLPAVARATGMPWWKVGYQGNENQSNTRRMWLLVKGDYVNRGNFRCPGRGRGRARQFDQAEVRKLQDFPCRKDVSYSCRLTCRAVKGKDAKGPKVLIADLNPLFENLPADYSNPFKLEPTKKQLSSNSINHGRRGQNVLFHNGSVKFVRNRRPCIREDDIFTLQDVKVYKGFEVPCRETDSFLAP